MALRTLLSFTLLTVMAAPLLTACGDSVEINKKLEDTDRKATQAMESFKGEKMNTSPLTISSRPWFGEQAINITSGQPLPSQYTSGDSITLTFDQPLSLRQTANLIQSVTGLRVVVNAATASGEGAGAAPSTAASEEGFLPVNGREVRGGKLVWQGALNDLLDQITDKFDSAWSYNGVAVTINQEITRTFMLHSLATVISEKSSVESGSSTGSGGGSTLPSVTSEGTTALNVWQEVQTVVNSIVQGHGRATFSPSTGTITVSGSPNAVQRVEDYLRFQNDLRLRRIAITVKVLELTLAQAVNTSVSTSQLLERIINNSDLSILSNTGDSAGLTASFIANGRTNSDDLQTVLSASKDVDRVSVVHSGSVVTLSDQPAPLQVGRQISYLARRSSTGGTEGTTGTETLEPGTVDVGLIMNVLPRVIEDDRVMLRLNVALTDTTQPFPVFPEDGEASEQIQLPEVDSTGFQQNTVLRSGETLVLAGFERNQSGMEDSGVPGFGWILGGSRNRNQSREVTVMLITANILPEDPITVQASDR